MTKRKIQSGFTLVEMLIAMGLLAAIFVASAFIFNSVIRAQQTASSVLEITQKLQRITSQLDEDFKGLCKDGPIFVIWVAQPIRDDFGVIIADGNGIYEGYERFDRIMFFANGNYQTYKQYGGNILTGNVARITYMLALDGDYTTPASAISAENLKPQNRILARSQHIQTRDSSNAALNQNFPGFGTIPAEVDEDSTPPNNDYINKNNNDEYDFSLLADWRNASMSDLLETLTIVTDIQNGTNDPTRGGLIVSPDDPDSLHMLLCEGVGTFSVQSWYDAEQRWIPEIDKNGDGLVNDTDFMPLTGNTNIDPQSLPGLLYPSMRPAFGRTSSIGTWENYGSGIFKEYKGPFDESAFNDIPGLGRALKFTFTIYDSKGIFPDGKVFSHIIYLD